MEDAAQYGARMDWARESKSAYSIASKRGWLDACCKHMEATIHQLSDRMDLAHCSRTAEGFEGRKAWRKQYPKEYRKARDSGWLDVIFPSTVRRPSGYWTEELVIQSASRFSSQSEWRAADGAAFDAAQRLGCKGRATEHMARLGGTDNDVVYIWRDEGTDLHKVGVTSERLGEFRIGGLNKGMDPRIVFMLKVDDARAVESELLQLGTDPELDSSIDGYTEFRRLTDAELGQAVSIAYEAALAA
jgi:hypothetical protein